MVFYLNDYLSMIYLKSPITAFPEITIRLSGKNGARRAKRVVGRKSFHPACVFYIFVSATKAIQSKSNETDPDPINQSNPTSLKARIRNLRKTTAIIQILRRHRSCNIEKHQKSKSEKINISIQSLGKTE
jgi:hypothetical protein